MSYTKITTSFKDHETVLTAAHLQHMENGIADNDAALVNRVRTDVSNQGLSAAQKSNARMNIDTPSNAELTAAVAAEADLRSAADAAMETKTDGIQEEVDQAKEDITDLQSVSSSMVKIKTAKGNPITIKDALAGKAKKLIVNLEPKQNLNGYSKPWIGGKGKNLASPITDSNGWSVNVGGSFSVNGDILAVTTTAAVSSGVYAKSGSVLRNILASLSGQYTWSIDVKASASISAAIGVQSIAMRNNVTVGTSWTRISGTGTFSATSVPFVIYNNGGTAATIEARNLQIEVGSTATNYEPYENICSINGYDTVVVTGTAKNLCVISDANITNIVNGYNLIPCKAGDTFYVYGEFTGTSSSVLWAGVWDSSDQRTKTVGLLQNLGFINSGAVVSFTVSKDGFFGLAYNAGALSYTISKLMIAKERFTADEYEPYGNSLFLSLASSAGSTVYSGTVTVNEDGSGTLVVDRALTTLNNIDATMCSYSTTTHTFYLSPNVAPGMKIQPYTDAFTGICNKFESYPGTPTWDKTTVPYIGFGSAQNFRFSIPGTTDVNEALPYINGCQVVYDLASPVSYPLTAAQFQTLVGTNHIWTNGTSLELNYNAEKYGNVDKLLAAFPKKTITGNPAFFIDGADDLPVESLSVAIEPKQDLNGYNHPWVGGTGNNLLQSALVPKAENGITFTNLEDGSLKVNGTATANAYYYFYTDGMTLKPGTYTRMARFNDGSSTGTIKLQCRIGSAAGADLFGTSADAQSATISEDTTIVVRLGISSGTTMNNVIVYPMIVSGTYTTATFPEWEPYENICPISGFNSATVTRRGKNLLPPNDIVVWQNGSINTSGNNFSSDYGIRMKDSLPIDPDTEYTFSAFGQSDDCAFFCYDASYNLLYRFQLWSINNGNGHDATFTTPSGTAYYRVRLTGTDYRPDSTMNMQLELGSTATDYEPYQETTLTISLEKAGTVYGGILDVKSGILTVDSAIATEYTFTGSVSSGSNMGHYVSQDGTGAKYLGDDGSSAICNMLPVENSYGWNAPYPSAQVGGVAGRIRVYGSFSTLAEFREQFAGLQICYPLATPITYQLTPQEVTTLLGNNTFTCDAGQITLSYRADPTLLINKLLNAMTAYGITV